MSKKKIISVLSIFCMLTTAFAFAACKDAKDGTNGINGKSAYELYCQANPEYAGTMEEWLESLKGEVGAQGENGKDGVGIKNVEIDKNGLLIITLTDGTVFNNIKIPQQSQPTECLRYQKIAGKDEYCVMGIGTVSDLDISIASTYNELPVTKIASYAFEREENLTSITIPESVTYIGDGAFSECTSLTSINIPEGVTYIGKSAFSECDNLSCYEDDNAYYLGNPSNPYLLLLDVKTTSITSITIPKGTKIIHSMAFFNCSNMTYIELPRSLIHVGYRSFAYCNSLTTVYYAGNQEEWEAINIDSDDTFYLTNATRYYYKQTEPSLNPENTAYNGNYWHYINDVPTIWIYSQEE